MTFLTNFLSSLSLSFLFKLKINRRKRFFFAIDRNYLIFQFISSLDSITALLFIYYIVTTISAVATAACCRHTTLHCTTF